ncbi:MAG: cation:proton antiporter [bacterium]
MVLSVELILIFIPLLLIIAYIFDLLSKAVKIPSVIFILLLGFLFKIILTKYNYNIVMEDIFFVAKVLGTVGLILIILESALELEINKENLKILFFAFINAFFQFFITTLVLAWVFYYLDNKFYDFHRYLINSIPLAVISSAIAIPAVNDLDKKNKDFITYEISFSDILGILFFNLLAYKNYIKIDIVWDFSISLLLMIILSLLFTLFLVFLIHYLDYYVKFVPIILSILMFYALAKIVKLPSLVLVLIFALFLNNIELFKNFSLKKFKLPDYFDFALMDLETKRFRDIVIEITF